MKCIKCNTINEEDAIFCKKCGYNLLNENVQEDTEKKKKPKVKTKTKIKTKTKVKKIKEKPRKNKENNKTIERRMSFGQKLLMFFMIILIIILLIVCAIGGYYYYQEENVNVPNVTGLTYEEAELILAKNDLKIIKEEKEVDDIELNDIVTEQNKEVGKEVHKNTKVRVIVGKIKEYILPDFIGLSIDKVKNTLNHNNIKYKITIKEIYTGEDNVVLSQSPNKKSKITVDKTVNLVVSKKVKKTEENIIDDKENDSEDDLKESTNNTSTEEENK